MKHFLKIKRWGVSFVLAIIGVMTICSCSGSDAPKGYWRLDCGVDESAYGDYNVIYNMNLDLGKPTISAETFEGESIMTYGTYNFSTINRIYAGYIDSVARVADNVYLIRMYDTSWDMIDLDTLRYYPKDHALTLARFGDENRFLEENINGVSEGDDNPSASTTYGKENSPLITWIIVIGALLFVLCAGIKFSGEYDGWEFVAGLACILAVLVSIVGYNVLFLEKIPGQLQLTQADGTSSLLIMFGLMLMIGLSYFWSMNIMQNGLAEDGYYVSLGCGKWVVAILLINVIVGMTTDFQSFHELKSDIIGAISFKNGVFNGILASSLVLALVLGIIQILTFFKNFKPLGAIIATILFPILTIGAIAMCVTCIPMLIIVIIMMIAVALFFHGTNAAFKSTSSESAKSTPPGPADTPDEIEFFEEGSIAHTTAKHIGCDVYMTSDGRKFEKDGNSVKPYRP